MTRAALVAVALVLAAPAVAPAATAHTQRSCPLGPTNPPSPGCVTTAYFTSVPGETNTVLVEQGAFGVRFADRNPIEANDGCRNVEAHLVECPGDAIEVRLGDRDDSVHAAHEQATRPFSAFGEEGRDVLDGTPAVDRMAGGPGDDVLRSGDGDDLLYPGTGADRLEAGAGDDTLLLADVSVAVPDAPVLEGMRGREIIYPAFPAPDRADGGPGRDAASYGGAPAGIVVNLAAARTGGWATADTLLSIADLSGGYGPDLLVGDEGANVIAAGNSRYKARLSGRGGDDRLIGGYGRDVLSGGEGDDDLSGHPLPVDGLAPPDLLGGGPGDDVGEGARGTVMDAETEWARIGAAGAIQVRRRIALRGRSAAIVLRTAPRARGRLVLRDRGFRRVLAIASFAGAASARTLLVRLPQDVVRRLARTPGGGEVPAALSVAGEPLQRAPVTIVG